MNGKKRRMMLFAGLLRCATLFVWLVEKYTPLAMTRRIRRPCEPLGYARDRLREAIQVIATLYLSTTLSALQLFSHSVIQLFTHSVIPNARPVRQSELHFLA
jgi:hypothetical protein